MSRDSENWFVYLCEGVYKEGKGYAPFLPESLALPWNNINMCITYHHHAPWPAAVNRRPIPTCGVINVNVVKKIDLRMLLLRGSIDWILHTF